MHGWWAFVCIESPNLFSNTIHRYWITWTDQIYCFTPHGSLNLTFAKATICSQKTQTGTILYQSHKICQRGKHTYVTGNLQTDSTWNPSQVAGKKFQKVEMVFMYLGDVFVIKWKDKSDVRVISNAHSPKMLDSFNRHGKSKRKPNSQTLSISTTTMCQKSIDQIKCCCITLHCRKL